MAVGELIDGAKNVQRILTVNAGSTSLKLERYELGVALAALADPPVPAYAAEASPDQAEAALAAAMDGPLDAVAHRFVRVPDGTPAVLRLTPQGEESIAAVGSDAPLHDASALRAVAILERLRPGVPQFAVSDSAFHQTMPPSATTYALPNALTRSGLRRIGYHGLSHQYAAHRGCMLAGLDVTAARVVTAHLGGGSSLCAVRNGTSIDTTMGYTPLEGLPMATRSGSVDPGLLIHLLRGGMSVDTLEDMLEHRSGLLGISGISADLKELLRERDDPAARLAIDVLGWRLRAAIGAMTATLGGADLIVFTGGIGEHAVDIRSAALEGGLGIGVQLDPARNARSLEGRIEGGPSPVRVAIVTAREGWQLAHAVAGYSNADAIH